MTGPVNTPERTAGGKAPSRSIFDLLRSLRGGPGYEGPRSDHFDGRHFFNPGATAGRSFRDFLRWRRTSNPKPWPRALESGQLALTFINHITFLIQYRGFNILTDPVYSERASPFRHLGPRRVRAPGLAFVDLPPIHLVLVSHNHYDHLDIHTLRRLEALHAPAFVTGLGNRDFLRSFGLRDVHELDWWQSKRIGELELLMTPAQHWSTRGPGNRNRTLWGGFIARATSRQVYFAGDTGHWRHFRDIRARCGPVDLALLPIGAYEPRWFMCNQHMNPEEAVQAHLELEARISVPTHFGCFRLTDEGIDDPLIDLDVARQRHGVTAQAFPVLETGETRIF